jgi:hypothetical protein
MEKSSAEEMKRWVTACYNGTAKEAKPVSINKITTQALKILTKKLNNESKNPNPSALL